MKRMIGILFLLFTVDVQGLRTRIFGGADADEGKYPYYAFLTGQVIVQGEVRTYVCGGSIIHKRWILTAAHCFRLVGFEKIEIHVGSVKASGDDSVIYHVERRIDHEAFDDNTYINDIALLRVEKDIVFSENVQPMELANADAIIRKAENVVFSGFGRTEYGPITGTLQTVDLKAYGYPTCKEMEPRLVETQICTLPEDNKGPCIGDSGGPLVNENGIQIGIYSGSYKPAELAEVSCGEFPEIFTRISSFRHWIYEKIVIIDADVRWYSELV